MARPTWRTWLLLTALGALALRAGVACGGGDDSKIDPSQEETGTTEEAGSPGQEGGPVPGEGGGAAETGTVDTGPPPPPSYCAGIIFYASFDQGLAADIGGPPPFAIGSAGTRTGKFGNAASFVVDAGADSSAVFYTRDDSGAPEIVPQQQGSMAFWFRQTEEIPFSVASFARPIGGRVTGPPAGLLIARFNNQFGIWNNFTAGSAHLTFSMSELRPFMRFTDFDHIVEAWRAPSDGGPGPLAILAINGGLGEIVNDAGADAAPYDATPDDAGNVDVPFRGVTTRNWPQFAKLVSLRLGGAITTAPQGSMDDFAVWNRVLSFEEIADLYKRPEPIGVTCKLP